MKAKLKQKSGTFNQQIIEAIKGYINKTSFSGEAAPDVNIEYFENEDYSDEWLETNDNGIPCLHYKGFCINISPYAINSKIEIEAEEITKEYNATVGDYSMQTIGTSSTEHNKELVNVQDIVWQIVNESGALEAIDRFWAHTEAFTETQATAKISPLFAILLINGCEGASDTAVAFSSHYIILLIVFFVVCCVVWDGMIKPIIQGKHTSKYTNKWIDNPVNINELRNR